MLPTLGSVAAVVQHHPSAGALHQVGPLVSSFMGPSPTLSLSEACKLQSLALLERIWVSSCTSDGARSPHWSLSNFLRSDKFYHRWQFAAAVTVAVERQDVALLQWLFSHFQGCVVTADVVNLAAEKGNLAVLQFLLANDSKESEGNKVKWGGNSIQQALTKGKLEAAHWLYNNIPLEGMNNHQRTWTIKAAMDAGDLDFCKAIMPIGRCLLDYSEYCSTPEVVEWKLDCGYLKRDALDAAISIRDLATTGRVDLMQRISDEHHQLPEDSEWPGEWQDALNDACYAGELPVVKWLVEHPVGRQTIDGMRTEKDLSKLLSYSAAKGHVEAMQYLYAQGAVDRFADALAKAIETDQMEAVKWLVEHFPSTETIPDFCMLDEAARRGRLEMLELFQSLGPSGVPGFFPDPAPASDDEGEQDEPVLVVVAKADRHRKVLDNTHWYRLSWVSTDPMDDAAANGELETVQWLHENRNEGCTEAAMNEAAANGYLDVVKWLHAHRSEGCSTEAMDFAASNGYLEVVQWLHENTTTGCTSAAMDLAADGGHFETLKWLTSNRSEGCTVEAIQNALSSSHLSVACWLVDQFPDNIPVKIKAPVSSKKFDVLLFLHARLPDLFTLDFIRSVRSLVTGRRAKPSDAEILDWLTANYPVPDMPQGQGERFEGLAGQILGNIAQQIAGRHGGQPAVEQQRIELQNNAVAMVMNDVMVVVHHGDEEDGDLDDNA